MKKGIFYKKSIMYYRNLHRKSNFKKTKLKKNTKNQYFVLTIMKASDIICNRM